MSFGDLLQQNTVLFHIQDVVTFANFTDVPLVRYQLVPIWNVATLIQKASNIKRLPSICKDDKYIYLNQEDMCV